MSGGVPAGARWTPVPDVFFSRFAPALDDPVALKVALHVLWRIHRRGPGSPPAVAAAALATDGTLRRGVTTLGVPASEVTGRLEVALDRLVAMGLLLEARVAGAAGPERWILVNAAEGQAARERLLAAREALPPSAPGPVAPDDGDDGPRPGIFALYEDNIGLLTPLLAEELQEAATAYPPSWIERAFRLAVDNNARSWRYVRAILERWARDGVDDETNWRGDAAPRARDSDGPFGAYIER